MKLAYTCTLVYLLLLSNPIKAQQRDYIAHIESANWTTEAKEQDFCLIKQEIPYYGEAIFIRKSGRDMLFELKSQKLFLKNAQITIMAEAAPWRSNTQSFEIGSFKLTQGHKPLSIKFPYASRMFQQLENGMMPTILYRDVSDQRDLISIAISPMNFRKQLKKFRQCESSLLEYDPEFIKDFYLYFSTNKSKLNATAKKNLAYAVKHLSVDKEIKQIKIDAHADNIGRRRFNDQLSEKRADAVKAYLIKVGADEKIIVTIAHGERDPEFSNKNKLGRSKNRHAHIQLLNTKPVLEGKEQQNKDKEDDFFPSDKLNTPIPSFINLEHLITK